MPKQDSSDQAKTPELVDALYRGILRRHPDSAGASHHIAKLGSNPSFNDAVVMTQSFLQSPEFSAATMYQAKAIAGRANDREPVHDIISLGSHCFTSMQLKNLGLKNYSGPFDWIFSRPQIILDCLDDDFKALSDRSLHRLVPDAEKNTKDANVCEHIYYRSKYGLRFMFNHSDLTDDLVYEALVRAIERFRNAIRLSQRNLFVLVYDEQFYDKDIIGGIANHLKKLGGGELLAICVRSPESSASFRLDLIERKDNLDHYDFYPTSELGALSFKNRLDNFIFELIVRARPLSPAIDNDKDQLVDIE